MQSGVGALSEPPTLIFRQKQSPARFRRNNVGVGGARPREGGRFLGTIGFPGKVFRSCRSWANNHVRNEKYDNTQAVLKTTESRARKELDTQTHTHTHRIDRANKAPEIITEWTTTYTYTQ